MYDIKFVGYTGFVVTLRHGIERIAAQEYCRGFVNRRRNEGYDVSYIARGEWEIQDDNAPMIGDDQGYLVVRRGK